MTMRAKSSYEADDSRSADVTNQDGACGILPSNEAPHDPTASPASAVIAGPEESALSEAIKTDNKNDGGEWSGGGRSSWRGDDRTQYASAQEGGHKKGLIALEVTSNVDAASTHLGTPTQSKEQTAPTRTSRSDQGRNAGERAEGEGEAQAQAQQEQQEQQEQQAGRGGEREGAGKGGAGDVIVWVTETAAPSSTPVSFSTTESDTEPSSTVVTSDTSSTAMASSSAVTGSATQTEVLQAEETAPFSSATEAGDDISATSSWAATDSASELAASTIASEAPPLTSAPPSAEPSAKPSASPSPAPSPSPSPTPSPSPAPSSTWDEWPLAPSSSAESSSSSDWAQAFSEHTATPSPASSAISPTTTLAASAMGISSEVTAAAHESYTEQSAIPASPLPPSSSPAHAGTAQGANKEQDKSSGPSKGTTAGAVIGGLLALLILGTIAICLLKARRRNGDRRKMARSSWYYGGDVALPEDQVDEREKSWLQSRFSAPSINGTYGQRFSSVVANLNPIHLARPSSSRFPASATPGFVPVPAPNTTPDRVEQMSEVPPLPLIASQGGWADRFFAQPDTKHVGNNGTPVSMTQAFPAPMIRSDISYGGSAQPLQVVNQSSAAGGPVRRLAPFIRVETPSNRSSMTSTTDSTASLAHAASVDLNRTAAKQAVLQTLAQSHRPPSSGLQYGSSYAAPPPLGPLPQPPTQLASSPIPTVPAPNSLHTHTPAGSHLSAPFEYDRDRNTQRQSVTDTASVYSRSSTAFEPHMTARRSLVQRSDTLGRAMVRDAMGGQAYGQEQPQMSGGFGNGMPRAL